MNRSFVISLVSLLSVVVSARALADEHRIALVVGHNIGSPQTEPLQYAQSDAERVYEVLLELGNFEVESELLTSPSLTDFDSALARLEEQVSSLGTERLNTTVLFYFSGHGDMESLHLADESINRDELLSALERIEARLVIVVLDACQTPVAGQARGIEPAASFDIGVLPSNAVNGTVVISSTQEGLPAIESEALGGAVFSHFFISALRGAADDDGDRRITLHEAYSFTFRNTLLQSSGTSAITQRPEFEIDLEGSGEIVLAAIDWGSASVVIPPGDEARLLVFQQRTGVFVGEIVVSEDRAVELAVPPDRLLLQWRAADSVRVAEIDVGSGQAYELDMEQFVDVPYDLIALRGGTLELYPNRLYAGFSFAPELVVSTWMLRHGPSVEYVRSLGSWGLGGGFGATWADATSDLYSTSELALSLSASVGYNFPIGPMDLEINLGPQLHWVFQERLRLDADRLALAGIESTPVEQDALGIGGVLGISWRIPLAQHWELRAQMTGGITWMEVAGDLATSIEPLYTVGGALMIGARF